MAKYKVLITGGSGFIGSALINKFKDDPSYEVFTIPHEVLLDYSTLLTTVLGINPDYIFHLAACGNHSTQNIEEDIFNANVIGTWNLLKSSLPVPYKAFINFGSSSEYGQKNTSMSELDLPEAATMYGCTKVAGTYLARAFAKKYEKPIVTVRPFSVYGPGEADHRFIPTVLRCLLKDEKLTLDPGGKHDWIYIADLLDALGLIADNASLLSGQVINVGTGKQSTNEFIVNALEIVSKKSVKTKLTKGMRTNDSEMWQADISKLKSFKWAPKWTLAHGLIQTHKYYKNKYYGN